ncbi:MAG TPA: hypothetical protein VGI85_13955 [Chthoniobacterales bacterium]|jgi:hypothetical protein
MTVPLTGVTDAEVMTLTVTGINGATASASVNLGVLTGDVDGNHTTSGLDVSPTKAASGQTANASNFRLECQ